MKFSFRKFFNRQRPSIQHLDDRLPSPFDGRLPAPKFVSIETTKHCNLKCRMCVQYNDGSTKVGPHMEMDAFRHIAHSVFPFVELWAPSLSGEPTMSRGFFEMLDTAVSYGVLAEIYTNGTLLTDKMIEHLAPSLGVLAISFDAPDKETFEFIRRGADFDRVVSNIKKLIRCCEKELPPKQLPQFGLNCVMMEPNIRKLPNLVRFASEELKVNYMIANHVCPVTDESKRMSLANHIELAKRYIDKAIEVANETGIPLVVQPLDQVTALMAVAKGSEREWALSDGHIEGLGYHYINEGNRRPAPSINPSMPGYKEIAARREKAKKLSTFPEDFHRLPISNKKDSIWYCDFLWNRAYIVMNGNINPCCVFGTPSVGNIFNDSFDEIWNNENYRIMRQMLVLKDPIPACKGCMHIRELTDPIEIDYRLGGAGLPDTKTILPLPPMLGPELIKNE